LPESKRSSGKADRSLDTETVDPRVALAQRYIQAAAADLAGNTPARPRSSTPKTSTPGRSFSLSISPATFAHLLLATVVFTFAALATLWCYHLLLLNFAAGRIVALPTGIIVAAAASYLSALYLGIIESTSTGRTEVDSLAGDWRDWFWTLPATLGMLAVAAFIGWFISLAVPLNVWLLIAICSLLLYPILQLSSLETGSPLSPLSIPILQSVIRHPYGWFVCYAISFAVANLLWAAAQLAWRDPPYVTVLLMGPLVAVALFFYAWLLGQLAFLISSDQESS
jgi:hypothetical protein